MELYSNCLLMATVFPSQPILDSIGPSTSKFDRIDSPKSFEGSLLTCIVTINNCLHNIVYYFF